MSTPIPQPPGVPFLGNINNLDRELPLRTHIQLQKQYGEIYQLTIFGASLFGCVLCEFEEGSDMRMIGRKLIFINSQNLANEVRSISWPEIVDAHTFGRRCQMKNDSRRLFLWRLSKRGGRLETVFSRQ
jgi:hypothetical protein